MFDGLPRKFFWTTVASGFLAYGSGLVGGPQKLNAFVKEVRHFQSTKRDSSASSSSLGEKPRLNPPQLNGMQAPELKEETGEVKYKANGKEYVLIEGKYYEYRNDHVYMVKGRRVFYFNDRAKTEIPLGEKIAQADKVEKAQADAKYPSDLSATGRREVQTETVNDESIMSPTEALKKVQELQQQMKERNQFLNDMGDEFKPKK